MFILHPLSYVSPLLPASNLPDLPDMDTESLRDHSPLRSAFQKYLNFFDLVCSELSHPILLSRMHSALTCAVLQIILVRSQEQMLGIYAISNIAMM